VELYGTINNVPEPGAGLIAGVYGLAFAGFQRWRRKASRK